MCGILTKTKQIKLRFLFNVVRWWLRRDESKVRLAALECNKLRNWNALGKLFVESPKEISPRVGGSKIVETGQLFHV